MRKILVGLIGLIMTAPVLAQTGAVQNHCFLGGKKIVTSGLSSTNYADGNIPSCTITVFLTGTTTKATIYADNISTPLANPFTAHTSTSVDPGGWIFWAATNAGLDVVMSGGIAPNTYPQPVTLTDIFPSQSFTPVVNPLSIKTNNTGNADQTVLNFTDTATVKFTNPSGGVESATVPDGSNSTKGVLKCDGTTTDCTGGTIVANPGVSIRHNGTPTTSQTVLNFLDATPSLPTGDVPVAFTTNGAGGLGGYVPPANVQTALIAQTAIPAAGTYIRVDPSGYTAGTSAAGYFASGSKTSALVSAAGASGTGLTGNGTVTWTYTLPAYINPANVTAVWASATASFTTTYLSGGSTTLGHIDCEKSGGITYTVASNYTPASLPLLLRHIQMIDTAGTDIHTVTCNAVVTSGSVFQDGQTVNVPQIYLQVADSIDTAPPANTIQVAPRLYYNQALNTLGLSYPLDSEIDTGAADVYVVTDPNMGLVPGQTMKIILAHASTSTTPTLALNGAPATTIVGPTGGALTSGDMTTTETAIVVLRPDLNWSLQNPQTSGGGGGSISGQTAGYAIEAATPTTATGPFPMDDAVTTAATITAHKALAVDDGSGAAGTFRLKQGTAAANGTTSVALTVPTSVTSYRIQLPGTHPTGSNNFLSCTSADPAVCTWAAASGSSGITSLNSQTGPAINIHSSDSSVTVTTTTNDINLTTTGGASGVQYNPTNTLYLWAGPDSIIGDDGTNWYYGNPIPLTSWSRTGSVCTFTSTSAHGLLMNDWVSADQVSGFAPPSPFAPWTTGYDLFQVASVPDSTHWTVNCPLISSTGASGGTAESANYFLPFYTASLPFFVGHGATQTALPVNSTITSMVANYSTVLHPRIIANSPNPTYVLITGGRNDIQNCTSVATLESDLQSVWASIHTDGGKVVQATLTPSPYNTTNIGCHTAFAAMAQLNEWIKGQSKTSANVASGQYWDRLVDANAAFYDLNDPNQITATGSMNAAVIANYANLVNEGMSTQGNALRGYPNYIQAGVNGGSLSPGFGISYVPSADSTFAFSWWNHAQTTLLMDVDTLSNRVGFSYLGAVGCLGTSSGGWLTGGACVGTTPNALTMNNSNTGAASGSTFDGSAAKTISTNSIGAPNLTASNTFSGATTQDFSGVSQLKLPVAGGYASAANGELGYDSTGKNWHVWGNAVDNIIPVVPVASLPSNGNCAQWVVTAGVYTLTQAGGPCGTSSGTVTTTGSPASGDIAAFSGASSITTATATQVNTLIKTLTGCNTATNVYVPQSGTCVAPSGGSGAWTNITGSITSSCNGTACSVTSGALVIAGSTTTDVTFSSIPAHNAMQIKVWGQGSAGVGGSGGYVVYRFNSDAAANYYSNSYVQSGSTLAANGPSVGQNQCYAGLFANVGASQVISDILFYADTTFGGKAVTSHWSEMADNSSTSDNGDGAFSCGWNQSTAITTIDSIITAGHYVAGTKFMILVQD